MEREPFEREQLDPRILEAMSRLMMLKSNHGLGNMVKISPEEEKELEGFLRNASESQIDEVAELAEKKRKYFMYIRKDLPRDDRVKLEAEMQADSELKSYIEKSLAEALAEKYAMWRHAVTNPEEVPNQYIVEMENDDIRTFFKLLDEYPEEVDTSLSFMSSSIAKGPHENSKYIIRSDEEKFLSEREQLISIRDYITGRMGPRDKDNFHNELIEDPRFRSMFLKIQAALSAK